MKKKHRIGGYVLFIVLAILIISLSFLLYDHKEWLSPDFVHNYFVGLGVLGYFAYIIALFALIILPGPSTALVFGGGYVYGLWVGTALALIAYIIASVVSFWLVRKYGRPLLERLVDKHHITHFMHVFGRKGTVVAFISYVIPIFPSDAVSLILGLTPMKYGTFLFLVTVTHIPRLMIINTLGNDLYAGFTPITYIILVVAVILVLISMFRERLKKIFFKELRFIEKEVGIGKETTKK